LIGVYVVVVVTVGDADCVVVVGVDVMDDVGVAQV